MAKYVYPAIFTLEDEGCYSVSFPDIDGCVTQGETLAEAIEMAQDALCLMLYDMEENGVEFPTASNSRNIIVNDNDTISLVSCDTLEYRRYFDNKAVKKTLTIPNWLNVMAEKNDINFSAVLQEALKERLHVN